jgi:hypothetical protein
VERIIEEPITRGRKRYIIEDQIRVGAVDVEASEERL